MQEEFHLQPPSMESSDHACSTPILLTEPLVRQSISQVMLMFISHSKRLALSQAATCARYRSVEGCAINGMMCWMTSCLFTYFSSSSYITDILAGFLVPISYFNLPAKSEKRQ